MLFFHIQEVQKNSMDLVVSCGSAGGLSTATDCLPPSISPSRPPPPRHFSSPLPA